MAPSVKTQIAVAPDGRRVTVSCRAERLQEEWFWHARLTSKAFAISVAVGRPQYAADSVAAGGYQLRERVSYGTHPLTVSVSPEGEGYLVTWESTHHSLVFGGPGQAPRLRDIITLLDELRPQDGVDGLRLRPAPGSETVMWGLFGVKFTDAGMVSFYPRQEATGLVPDQPGLSVPAGDLWRKTIGSPDGSAGQSKYILANDSSVAVLDDDFGRAATITQAAQEALLSSLSVKWS
ncbi:hypothetical protein [Micromonospora sp. WMMC250]|uniref:hypothetical protein n=1 Tax=Micromonospora sp. WMMC250 TaxID=3014781 RepID=UPI0022B5FA43|nr:hypothetical protein [Micromonospora sp. WMMC250]MCZ7376037.1 hypothetical protein [Micromonospora sp. WMMC250]